MMKRFIFWVILTLLLMIGCPWLTAAFAGDAGMIICLFLFFAVNPIFSAMCGISAGKHLKQLWGLPFIVAGTFLAGAWWFLEMGERAFLMYCRTKEEIIIFSFTRIGILVTILSEEVEGCSPCIEFYFVQVNAELDTSSVFIQSYIGTGSPYC